MVDFAGAVIEDGTTLLEMLKSYLGIDPANVDDDAALSRAMDMSGETIEVYLDRVIVKRPVEEYFARHFETVVLHNPQVDPSEPLIVTLDGITQSGYSIFLQSGRLGHLTRSGTRMDMPLDWRAYNQVVVTYTAGYDKIPSDVAQSIVYTAAGVYGSEGTGAMPGDADGTIKGMSIVDVGSISYDTGSTSGDGVDTFPAASIIPDTAAQMLTRYKRMSA